MILGECNIINTSISSLREKVVLCNRKRLSNTSSDQPVSRNTIARKIVKLKAFVFILTVSWGKVRTLRINIMVNRNYRKHCSLVLHKAKLRNVDVNNRISILTTLANFSRYFNLFIIVPWLFRDLLFLNILLRFLLMKSGFLISFIILLAFTRTPLSLSTLIAVIIVALVPWYFWGSHR